MISVLGPSSDGHAQQFDLNQFRASETTQDGFAVSTAADQGHLRFGAQLYLDYSDDPLLFAGLKVVHQQLTGELITSLGLWDRLIVFTGLRYHFMLRGQTSGLPLGPLQALAPTGSGLGDLRIGARVRAWGEEKDIAQIAVQGALYVHTASMADGDQNYRGGPTDSPRLGGDVEVLARSMQPTMCISRPTSAICSARTSSCRRMLRRWSPLPSIGTCLFERWPFMPREPARSLRPRQPGPSSSAASVATTESPRVP